MAAKRQIKGILRILLDVLRPVRQQDIKRIIRKAFKPAQRFQIVFRLSVRAPDALTIGRGIVHAADGVLFPIDGDRFRFVVQHPDTVRRDHVENGVRIFAPVFVVAGYIIARRDLSDLL